ncbi:MAG: sigma-54-dependent Fis family transcriptional regulator, partial [Ignavibacteriae bacterium]|nr:sigma-54-dependent Fis family transcriptional regulator [Ignavibacteriota bacterium]
ERREDIPLLANAFSRDICERYGMALKRFSDAALQKLRGMDWPGNVRELRNIVERLVIMTPQSTIEADQIEKGAGEPRPEFDNLLSRGGTFQDFKDRAEAAYIRKQLDEHGWNISRTAEALDIQRSHLYNKMKKFGLTRGDERES